MKISRLFLLFLLFIYQPEIHSQNYIPYYNLVDEAEFQAFFGRKDVAFGLYNKAFSLKGISPKARDLYFMGKLYLERNEKEKATLCFKKIFPLPDGYFSLWANKQKAYFLNYYKEIEIQSLITEAELKENEHFLEVKPIQDSLSRFVFEDQRLRKFFIDSIQPRYKEGDKIYDSFVERVDSNDYVNQSRFLSFIRKHGYPGLYLIGNDEAASILMHIHCEQLQGYKETLYDLLLKGKMEPFHYVHMVDQVTLKCMGRAVYNDGIVCDICPEHRAEKRASVGMSKYFNDPGTRPYIERQFFKDF